MIFVSVVQNWLIVLDYQGKTLAKYFTIDLQE